MNTEPRRPGLEVETTIRGQEQPEALPCDLPVSGAGFDSRPQKPEGPTDEMTRRSQRHVCPDQPGRASFTQLPKVSSELLSKPCLDRSVRRAELLSRRRGSREICSLGQRLVNSLYMVAHIPECCRLAAFGESRCASGPATNDRFRGRLVDRGRANCRPRRERPADSQLRRTSASPTTTLTSPRVSHRRTCWCEPTLSLAKLAS